MISEISKDKLDLAWKVYNYVNMYENTIFGSKTANNCSYMFILTLVALYGEMTTQDILKHTGASYKDVYKYLEGLTRYYSFLERNGDTFKLTNSILRSVKDAKIKDNPVNETVFCTVLNNMKYHTQIFQDNLKLEENGKFKMMRALLNPVISNPIHMKDCQKLSTLGYMRYKPQKKELKLNAIAYNKDWVGTSVI